MTGNLGYFVNADAVTWWLREVWPVLRRVRPGLRVVVAGDRPARGVRRAVRRPAGRWSSLPRRATCPAILRQATLALAPMRCGAGVPIKVLEAWACGVPVVASPWAVAGTSGRQGEDFRVVGQHPIDWVSAIQELLDSPGERQRLADNGRRVWPPIIPGRRCTPSSVGSSTTSPPGTEAHGRAKEDRCSTALSPTLSSPSIWASSSSWSWRPPRPALPARRLGPSTGGRLGGLGRVDQYHLSPDPAGEPPAPAGRRGGVRGRVRRALPAAVLYPAGLTRTVQYVLAGLVIGVNLGAYGWVLLRARRSARHDPEAVVAAPREAAPQRYPRPR